MTRIDAIASGILSDLISDFQARGLPASSLASGYEGISLRHLREVHGKQSPVDFDLALSELENADYVNTGPIVPFENDPNSGLLIFASFSQREYLHLTDKGYREAQRRSSRAPKRPSGPHVAITNSTIFQSAIGAGDQFSQTLNIENEAELIDRLSELARSSGRVPEEEISEEVTDLVEAARAADLGKIKPLFQRLYGIATNGVGQVAWGVVSAIIAASMGVG